MELIIYNAQDLPQVNFTKLNSPLDQMEFDDETLADRSKDQRLLLEYVRGISRGNGQPKVCSLEDRTIESCMVVDISNTTAVSVDQRCLSCRSRRKAVPCYQIHC